MRLRLHKFFVAEVLSMSLLFAPTVLAASARPERGNHATEQRGGNRAPNRGHQPSRPGNNHNKPGKPNKPNRPNKPAKPNKPGKPGNHHNPPRPGGHISGPHHGGVHHPGNMHHPKPWKKPWMRPLPPPPPPRPRVVYAVNPINAVLGVAFGSLLNAGVSQLINAGYQVAGAIDDAIYLNNVARYGVTWPDVTMYYTSGALSGARFQYPSMRPGRSYYNNAYAQLVASFGQPVSTSVANGVTTCTWWGGNNTGYITLSYGPGLDQYGNTMYYTDMIYGR